MVVLRPSTPVGRRAEILADLQRARTVAIVPVGPLAPAAPSSDNLQLPALADGGKADSKEYFQVRRLCPVKPHTPINQTF